MTAPVVSPDLLEFFYLEALAGVTYSRRDWQRLSDEERIARLTAVSRLEEERLARVAGVLLDPVLALSPLDGGRLARRRVLEEMVARGAST